MSKRAFIEPHWLDNMLQHWGSKAFRARSPLSYPQECPYLKERIARGTSSREPWEVTSEEHDEVAKAVDGLELRHKHAITRAYKPWTVRAIDDLYPGIGGSPKVWKRLVVEAAAILESKLARKGQHAEREHAH